MTHDSSLDARVLGQILILQSSLYSAPNETKLGEQLCYSLTSVPGVRATALYVDGKTLADRTSSDEMITEWPKSWAEIVKQSSADNASVNRLELIPLQTRKMTYGHLALALADDETASYYLPFLENVVNQIALLIENKRQEADLRILNATLESQVQDRTKALVESERLFRSTFESAAVGMCLTSIEGDFQMVNPELCKILGYSEEEIVSKNLADFTHPDDVTLSFEKNKFLLDGKARNTSFEKRYIHNSGREIWASVGTYLVRDDNDEPQYFVTHIVDITKKKLAEEALKESKAFLDNMPDLAYIADTYGNVVWVNAAIERVTGFTPEEIIDKPFVPLFIESDHTSLLNTYKRTLAGESLENSLTFKSGVTCHFTSLPKHNQQGDIIGTFGVARDITERLAAEHSLQISEARLKKAQEMAKIGNWEYDIASGKVWGSEEIFQIFGIERTSEFLPLHEIESYIIDAKRVNRALVGLITKNEVYDIEFQIHPRTREGLSHIHSMADLVCDADGKPEKVVGVIQDITERKRVERELRESEEYHRDLFDNSPTALYLQDFTGVEVQVKRVKSADISDLGSYLRENPEVALRLSRAVVFSNVNQVAVDLYKAGSKRDLLGSLDRVIIPGDFQHFIDQVVAFTNGEDSWVGEAKNYNFQKEIIDLVIRKRVINRHVNGLSKVLVSIIDVTELHKAHKNKELLEAQLHRAQKMEAIGTLAGGVAHDLNNILGGLVSYPELLLMQLPDDSPLRKSILTIQKSGEKAAAVVQDLLTLARRGVVTTEVVNLNDVISEYLKSPEQEMLQSHHPGVYIETHLEKNALNILGSSIHLSKTLMNLSSNAAEAMSEGGKLTVSTKNRYIDRPIRGYDHIKEGDYVVLTVSDTGTGISPDDIGKIFEPFYTRKKMGRSGTGLGMAVVWGTVKDHNGYIDVQSTEGKGTTFTLYFPVTRNKLTEDKFHSAIESYSGNGESILIVDDVEEQRNIASGMLEELGYSIVSVSSGEEAVEYLKTHKVDLLVLDMIMDPGLDGLDTYKKILELHPGQKAVIASGFSETDRVKELQSLGAGGYIKKPLLLEKIGLAVKKELEK